MIAAAAAEATTVIAQYHPAVVKIDLVSLINMAMAQGTIASYG